MKRQGGDMNKNYHAIVKKMLSLGLSVCVLQGVVLCQSQPCAAAAISDDALYDAAQSWSRSDYSLMASTQSGTGTLAEILPSVTSKGAPEVTKATDADGEDITDVLVVTPYSERDDMSGTKKDTIERAYKAVNLGDIAKRINDGIQNGTVTLPESWGGQSPEFNEDNISVTDVFYIHEKDDSGVVKLGAHVTMKTTVSDNALVTIFYYNGSEWVQVPSTRDGAYVTFQVDAFGPYMVVTNTVAENTAEVTEAVEETNTAEAAESAGTTDTAVKNTIPTSPQTGE